MSASLNLTVTSPPQSFDEPITLTEIKKYLNLPERSPADTDEDALLSSLIAAAREEAEREQGRDLCVKQYDLTLDYFPCVIETRDRLVSVDLVQYTDSTGTETELLADVDYIVDAAKHPGLVMPPYGQTWPSFTPWPSSAVLVRFTAGIAPDDAWWSGHGDLVKTGMKMLVKAWFFAEPMNDITRFAIYNCLRHGALERAI